MIDIELSAHTREMLVERNISEDWMWRAINAPDKVEPGVDNNTHCIKSISEHGGRFLRVVVNPHVYPNRVVTVFFDRR
jgi:hypothetical protein